MSRILFFLLIICAVSCSEDRESDFEQDKEYLASRLDEILDFAASVPCTSPETWKTAAYGAKPCGGPWGYVAYSSTLNEDELLAMIDSYTAKNREFNEKWGIGSDCSVEPEPVGVACADGKGELVY